MTRIPDDLGPGAGGSPRDAPFVPPPPGFLISPKAGVLGMLVAFGLAVGAFVWLGVFGRGDDEPEGRGLVPIETSQATDGDLAGLIPEHVARELQATMQEWFQGAHREPISDAAAEVEREWATYLTAGEVGDKLDRLAARRVYRELENVPRVRDEPGSVRGSLVRVWGRVESVGECDVPQGDTVVTGWRLTMTDRAGLPWVVTSTRDPGEGVPVGSWVKVFGVFTKLWPLPDRRDRAFHVFTLRPIRPSFPPVTHETPDVEWLPLVRDSTQRESMDFEELPFHGMLNYVRQLGPEGYRELRDTGALPIADLTGSDGADPLVNTPDLYRFRVVRLQAAPLQDQFVVEELLDENSGNIDFVYRGYLVDHQNRPVRFISPFPRGAFDFKGARMAEIEGFFYKRQVVTGRNDHRYWMPVLIGTAITPTRIGSIGPETDPKIVLTIVGVGSLLMLGIFLFAWRRSPAKELEIRSRAALRRARRAQPPKPG